MLVAGGGPVGLAAAVELTRRGVDCVVVEPRASVSRLRPRAKTVNVRTMEHLRRWGLADRLRAAAPLPVSYSQDVVFCTSLTGRELSRFTGVFGLHADGDRFAELGQQAPQYVLEELLREVVRERLHTGYSVTGVEQDDERAVVTVRDAAGEPTQVRAGYVIGCDGARSAVREAIGSAYVGEHALRPNLGMVFSAPDLEGVVRHGPAVHYWTVNAGAPALMGPLDRDGTWWIIVQGVDRETGERDQQQIIEAAVGRPVAAAVLSTDPWTARMELVDHARRGRVFLAGDAAHLNPPFGGHGFNTGVGDAVDLGWKLAAVLAGWGGPGLLDSYEAERRPVQDLVIRAAADNMRTLSGELVGPDLELAGPAGDAARLAVHERIQQTKAAEFHALDLVLDVGVRESPIVAAGAGDRLPHAWLPDGRSLYDLLGPDFTLLVAPGTDPTPITKRFTAPLRVVELDNPRFGPEPLLVRPDQHIAWSGDPVDPGLPVDRITGY